MLANIPVVTCSWSIDLPLPTENLPHSTMSIEILKPTKREMHTKSTGLTKPVGPHYNLLTEKIAIDCEMMQSNIGQVLGRVSIINYQVKTSSTLLYTTPSLLLLQTRTKSILSSLGTTSIRRTALSLFLKSKRVWSSFSTIAL